MKRADSNMKQKLTTKKPKIMKKTVTYKLVKPIWLNTEIIQKDNLLKVKPCHKLGYCPYGMLVEEFPISERRTKLSCTTFGHDCPVFYHAEDITE